MDTKAWYASKVLWTQIVAFVIALLGFLQGQELIAAHPGIVAGIVGALSVLGIVQRFLTDKPLSAS